MKLIVPRGQECAMRFADTTLILLHHIKKKAQSILYFMCSPLSNFFIVPENDIGYFIMSYLKETVTNEREFEL